MLAESRGIACAACVAVAPRVVAASIVVAACHAPPSCPRFAASPSCACEGDGVVVLGACVSPKTADAFCGKGARFTGVGCAFRECPNGIDLATGECVSAVALREIAATSRVALGPSARLACDSGVAVVDGDVLACVPPEATCPRGTLFEAGRCIARTRCRAGEVAVGARCANLLGGAPARYTVHVAAWARAAFGADGGAGTADLCAPLARRPHVFGVARRASATLAVRITLRFPENDVADVRANVTGAIDGAEVPASGGALLDESTRPFFRALQALGGEATAAAVTLTVSCVLEDRGKPHDVAQ